MQCALAPAHPHIPFQAFRRLCAWVEGHLYTEEFCQVLLKRAPKDGQVRLQSFVRQRSSIRQGIGELLRMAYIRKQMVVLWRYLDATLYHVQTNEEGLHLGKCSSKESFQSQETPQDPSFQSRGGDSASGSFVPHAVDRKESVCTL